MNKILLVSNMYPSKKYPHYGVFVKNTEDILYKMSDVHLDKIVIKKNDNKIIKLLSYSFFYILIILKSIFGHYDVLYGHYISHISIPILVIRKFNKKINIVINVHGNDVVADLPKDTRWFPFVRKALLAINKVIVPSNYFKKIMIEDYNVSEDIIYVFPSGGVNSNVFFKRNKDEILAKYKLDSSKTYIGYVSRIEKDKGWDIFLKVANKLKDNDNIRFIVVGGGSESRLYDIMVNDLGLNDRIDKFSLLSQEQIAEIFNVLDIFIFPTFRKSESLGLVGLEAMSCGTILLASDKYGPSTYVENRKNGFTFKTGDYISLYNSVIEILGMSQEYKNKIREKAVSDSRFYDDQFVSEKFINIFKDIIGKKNEYKN